MPAILHGFLTDKSSLTDSATTVVDYDVRYPFTAVIAVTDYTHACITWDAVFLVKNGRITLISGFPSPSVISSTGSLKKIPTQEAFKQIAESWTHRFCLNNAGHCFTSCKDSGEWAIVENEVKEQERFLSISAGDTHTMGITAKNRLCTITSKEDSTCMISRQLSPGLSIHSVSCGKEHVLLLTSIGLVLTFGNGSRGQLGHGSIDSVEDPQVVQDLEGLSMVAIAAGGWHSATVSDIGDVYTWGWNETGQLGFPCRKIQESSGESSSNIEFVNVQCVPCVVDLPLTSDDVKVIDVSCGSRHTAVVTDDGQLYTWGWNKYGQLGHSDKVDRDVPTRVLYGEPTEWLCEKSTHSTTGDVITGTADRSAENTTERVTKESCLQKTAAIANGGENILQNLTDESEKVEKVTAVRLCHQAESLRDETQEESSIEMVRNNSIERACDKGKREESELLLKAEHSVGLTLEKKPDKVTESTALSEGCSIRDHSHCLSKVRMKGNSENIGNSDTNREKYFPESLQPETKQCVECRHSMYVVTISSDSKLCDSCLSKKGRSDDRNVKAYLVTRVHCGGWSTLVKLEEQR